MVQCFRLAIVGGSLESCALSTDGDSRYLRVRRGDPFTLHSCTHAAARDALVELIEDLAAAYGISAQTLRSRTCNACFAVGGVNTETDEIEAKLLLSSAGWPTNLIEATTIVDYSHAALLAGNCGLPAIAVVGNAGSAVYTTGTTPPYQLAKGRKTGGWGPFIADPGSAFDFGVLVLRHVMHHHDLGNVESCSICQAALCATELNGAQDIAEWFHELWHPAFPPAWRRTVAQLGLSFLAEIAAAPPATASGAIAILRPSILSLSELIISSLSTWDCLSNSNEEVPVVLSGAVFENSIEVAQALCNSVSAGATRPFSLSYATFRPAVGAWLSADAEIDGEVQFTRLLDGLRSEIAVLPQDEREALLPNRAGTTIQPRTTNGGSNGRARDTE